MSPLSDTTNLAAATVDCDIVDHIKHLFHTTFPAMLLALAGFTLLNLLAVEPANTQQVNAVLPLIVCHKGGVAFDNPARFKTPHTVLDGRTGHADRFGERRDGGPGVFA